MGSISGWSRHDGKDVVDGSKQTGIHRQGTRIELFHQSFLRKQLLVAADVIVDREEKFGFINRFLLVEV